MIFALLLGGQLYGFIGAFIALPIAAIAARDGRLPAPPPGARAVGPAARPAGRARRGRGPRRAACPECGAPAWRPGAARCPACGTELGDRRRGRDRGVRRAVVISAPGRLEGLRRAAGAAGRVVHGRPRRADRDHRPQRRRQDDAAADPRRLAEAERRRGRRSRTARSAGCRSSRRSTRSSRWPRTCACSRGWRSAADVRRQRRPDARADRAARARRRRGRQALGRQPPAGQHRDRPARASRRCCCSTSRPRRSTRASARCCGRSSAGSPRRGTAVVFATHDVAEAERYADRVLVLADGELLFSGTPARARARPSATRARDFESAPSSRFLHERGPLSDALAAAQGPADPPRSPLLVALLVVYPVVIVAADRRSRSPPARTSRRSRSPTSCRRRSPRSAARRPAARRDPSYADELFKSIDPIRVDDARGGDREGARPARRSARS